MILNVLFVNQCFLNIYDTWGDSDVILPTTVTAAMLEVCYVAAVQRRRLTCACKLFCVEQHLLKYVVCEMFFNLCITFLSDYRILAHSLLILIIPPTWRRGFYSQFSDVATLRITCASFYVC